MASLIVKPQPAQERFFSTSADIAVYGGAAGSGKSWSLLVEPLRHIGHPGFGAVIFRKTYPQITAEGGLWDKSLQMYGYAGAKPNRTETFWVWPNGNKVALRHMQHVKNMLDWQGSEIPLIEWDELTHFESEPFFYMLSRNRTTCGIKPYVRATTNPDADSWVAELVSWWIDSEGYPDPEKAGVIRWFIRRDDAFLWGDTMEELLPHSGTVILIDPETEEEFEVRSEPKSFTFIPANVYDNPALLKTDPGYLSNLEALDLVERERLLGGNWLIRAAAGKLFNRSWFNILDELPEDLSSARFVRFWDLAATERKMRKGNTTSTKEPDFTSGTLICMTPRRYYIVDNVAVQMGPADVDLLILETAQRDRLLVSRFKGASYAVRWEKEGGAAGPRDSQRIAMMLSGFDAYGVRPQGDKVTRAKPLAAQAKAGNVSLIKGDWNLPWLAHMHGQPDLPKDDIMDASSGAFNALTESGVEIAPPVYK